MKHKHAEFIKAWVDASTSVQYRIYFLTEAIKRCSKNVANGGVK